MMLGGAHALILLLVWIIGIAVIGAALYFVVRLAVLHALKAHTRWVEGGQR
ncbi:beta-lactamase regulating signal transducer with metallopeptidase domain [Microbacterium testaceum]|uniref:hypothetical protein n=1 Tax=Microbacterium TaxID=33882 RepID=UPI0027899D04|nr:hypothetical protein [Microbacterium testaceum]MDQ1172178.1 beta-lactamase regulating signal transducer with metallopeptidase domain [Microbacterium testaceum]